MKKFLALLLALTFCVSVVACASDGKDAIITTTAATTINQAAEPEPEPLLAGFAERDFTPTEMGGIMPGSTGTPAAYGVEMPLLANAAAFTSGDTSVILISMDMLSFHEEYGNAIRKRINEATGVPEKNIMIAATHSHTSIAVEYQVWLVEPDEKTSGHAADMAVEAAIAAYENREEAKMGFKSIRNSTYNFCRDGMTETGDIKTWYAGVTQATTPDSNINVMRVDDTSGDIKCFIVNYANHPDTYSNKIRYSSDYPGYLREALKKEYGEDVTVLYFNGTEGDINFVDYKNKTHTEYHGGTNNTAKNIGEGIAKSVIQVNRHIRTDDTCPAIESISKTYTTARRLPTAKEFEWAANAINSASGLDKCFAVEYTTEDYSTLGNTYDIEIHTIRIGEWAMVGLPGEIYTDIGRAIKADSPYELTSVVSLANGTHGYITPDKYLDTSCYPARVSKYNAYSGYGTADILINNSLAQLNQMKSGGSASSK